MIMIFLEAIFLIPDTLFTRVSLCEHALHGFVIASDCESFDSRYYGQTKRRRTM
jgi:hypothetical protein